MSQISNASTYSTTPNLFRPPLCRCGHVPKLYRSKTADHPDQVFWRCPVSGDTQCSYYFWAEEYPSSCCGYQEKQLLRVIKTIAKEKREAQDLAFRGYKIAAVLMGILLLTWAKVLLG